MSCGECPHCLKQQEQRCRIATAAQVKRICDAVASAYGLEPRRLSARERPQHIAAARHVAFYLVRDLTSLSFPEVGAYFNRDHSTIMHGIARLKQRMAEMPQLAQQVQHLRAKLAQ